jgi:hypothetical protein
VDRDDTEAEDSAGAPAITTGVAALYRVPVPAELEPWSAYPVEGLEAKRKGDNIKIEYIFPRWLIGGTQVVELAGTYQEGAASFPVSAGALGGGECFVVGARLECTETLPSMIINRAQAEAQMKQAGLPAGEIGQRLLVTDVFISDPIGIIELDMP